ncbi:MAG TPA: hypothetical protein VFR51_07365 [Pyrinomonadaceae bacterium]|nr:hypothetical protein [Pyrinomonadaceae bacterium]
MKQPAEVAAAYEVCREFQRVFGEDLDFDRAFEQTFTKNPARRRAIARAEINVSDVDLARIDDATLIGIYKDETQLFWLLLMLIDPDGPVGESELSPPEIDNVYDRFRVRPKTAQELREYAAELKQDVIAVRAHLNQLSAKHVSVAERIQQMKKGLSDLKLPDTYVVKPLTSYRNSNVLGANEKYYQIGNYEVVRENGEMKIIGIRFFTTLF